MRTTRSSSETEARRVTRRRFLATSGTVVAAAGTVGFPAVRGAEAASSRLIAGVMGLGRGLDHVRALLQIPNAEVRWLCDIDENRSAAAAKVVAAKQEAGPKQVRDFRRMLEDRELDAIFIAAPNFWHAPATILACQAGKHVYVEKPGSHNAREGEWMVEAARKHGRKVQMGTQRRSWPAVIEAMQKLREGVIGRVLSARTYYDNARPSIGQGKAVPVPAHLDYDLWQGPVPERPYVDNLVHYNWHWRWHWGGGELANNGPHALDLARWGLGVTYPRRVTYNGGRYYHRDDQETPDTGIATFDFGGCDASFDHSSCNPRANLKVPWVSFLGERGVLTQEGSGYKVYDLKGKEIGSGTGPGGDVPHIANFASAIREGTPLNQEIGEGQKSVLLCHLGNIAYRLRRELAIDPETGRIRNDAEALRLWGRDYRAGWEPKV